MHTISCLSPEYVSDVLCISIKLCNLPKLHVQGVGRSYLWKSWELINYKNNPLHGIFCLCGVTYYTMFLQKYMPHSWNHVFSLEYTYFSRFADYYEIESFQLLHQPSSVWIKNIVVLGIYRFIIAVSSSRLSCHPHTYSLTICCVKITPSLDCIHSVIITSIFGHSLRCLSLSA